MAPDCQEEERFRIERPCVFIVEGKDDQRLVNEMAKHLKLNRKIQVDSCGGIDNLRNHIEAMMNRVDEWARVKVLGIIRDADNDADRAFRSVCKVLSNCGLDTPTQPGGFTKKGKPRVGVLILPPKGCGCIESLCWKNIQATAQGKAELIEQFWKRWEGKFGVKNGSAFSAKSKTYVYIAMHEPRNRIGEAVSLWDFSHEAFAELRTFLEKGVKLLK